MWKVFLIIFFLILNKKELKLTKGGISSKVDDTNVSVGKRYSRTDELCIPYAITIDG